MTATFNYNCRGKLQNAAKGAREFIAKNMSGWLTEKLQQHGVTALSPRAQQQRPCAVHSTRETVSHILLPRCNIMPCLALLKNQCQISLLPLAFCLSCVVLLLTAAS